MCSKNQEVDPLFAHFITKDFLIQRIFRVLRNSFFQNKRPVLQHSFRPSDGSMLPDRLSLKADPPASVNFHPSFKYSWFAITFLHAILFLLTEYDTLLHLIDCQFINMEKSVTCFLLKNRTIYSRTWQYLQKIRTTSSTRRWDMTISKIYGTAEEWKNDSIIFLFNCSITFAINIHLLFIDKLREEKIYNIFICCRSYSLFNLCIGYAVEYYKNFSKHSRRCFHRSDCFYYGC